MRFRFAPVVLMLGSLSLLGFAQPRPQHSGGTQPAASTKVDTAKEADIRRMFDAMGGAKRMDEMIRQMFEQVSSQIQANLPKSAANPERTRRMTDVLMKKVRSRIKAEDLIEQAIPVYDKYFSDEEIVALTRFYETSLGQKFMQVMPDISRETMTITLARYEKIMPDIMREMQEEFPELREDSKAGPENP